MPKRATAIHLSEKEQEGLTRLTRRHRSEQQIVLRAHIILAAAQDSSNSQIARELDINVDTVRLWRDRWANWQETDQERSDQEAVSLAHRLQDAPRPGALPKFTVEQRAQMAALARRGLQDQRAVPSANGQAERSPTNSRGVGS